MTKEVYQALERIMEHIDNGDIGKSGWISLEDYQSVMGWLDETRKEQANG